MAVSLGAVLAFLRPEADPSRDFAVVQAADGSEKVVVWDAGRLGPMPTPEAIASASLSAAKAENRAELKRAFRAQFEPAFEGGFLEVDYLLRRLSLNLVVPQAERDRLQAVGAAIDRLRALIGQSEQAQTVEAVRAVRW